MNWAPVASEGLAVKRATSVGRLVSSSELAFRLRRSVAIRSRYPRSKYGTSIVSGDSMANECSQRSTPSLVCIPHVEGTSGEGDTPPLRGALTGLVPGLGD